MCIRDRSEQGVVEGYPDGTFKGERNITRYEMAQIIARMLAKEDQDVYKRQGVYVGGTGLQTDALKYLTKHEATNVTFWRVTSAIAFQNVTLSAAYLALVR